MSDDGQQELEERSNTKMAGEVVARASGISPKEVPDIKRSMSSMGIPEEQIDKALRDKASTVNAPKVTVKDIPKGEVKQ